MNFDCYKYSYNFIIIYSMKDMWTTNNHILTSWVFTAYYILSYLQIYIRYEHYPSLVSVVDGATNIFYFPLNQINFNTYERTKSDE